MRHSPEHLQQQPEPEELRALRELFHGTKRSPLKKICRQNDLNDQKHRARLPYLESMRTVRVCEEGEQLVRSLCVWYCFVAGVTKTGSKLFFLVQKQQPAAAAERERKRRFLLSSCASGAQRAALRLGVSPQNTTACFTFFTSVSTSFCY